MRRHGGSGAVLPEALSDPTRFRVLKCGVFGREIGTL